MRLTGAIFRLCCDPPLSRQFVLYANVFVLCYRSPAIRYAYGIASYLMTSSRLIRYIYFQRNCYNFPDQLNLKELFVIALVH